MTNPPSPIRTGILGALLLALAGGPAAGQPQPAPPGNTTRSTSGRTPPPPQPADPVAARKIDVDFPGGTVAEFVESVQAAASPEPVNVLLPDAASQIPMGPVRLKSVSVRAALNSIAFAFPRSSEHRFNVGDFGGEDDSAEVYAIEYQQAPTAPQPVRAGNHNPFGEPAPRLVVFSLRDLLELTGRGEDKDAFERLLSPINAALSLANPSGTQKPELLVHEDSGMLIVRAQPDDVNTVQQILATMREDLARGQKSNRATAAMRDAANARLRGLAARIDAIQVQRQELERTREMVRAKIEEGVEAPQALSDIDVLLAQASAAIAAAEADYAQSRAEFEGMYAAQPAAPPISVQYHLSVAGNARSAISEFAAAMKAACPGIERIVYRDEIIHVIGDRQSQWAFFLALQAIRQAANLPPLDAPKELSQTR